MEIPKIIYPCNHEIISVDAVATTKAVTKIAGDVDTILTSGAISRVLHVYQLGAQAVKFFFEGEDFVVSQAELYRKLEWISLVRPETDSVFLIEFVQNSRVATKYTETDCPRCNGNGWYVSFLLDKNAVVISSFSKLVQDFIKVLFTKKQEADGYGSNLYQLVGAVFASESAVEAAVTQEINDCVVQLQNIQASELSSGAVISDEERIAGVVVSDAYYDEDTGGFAASITLKNAASQKATLTFNI